MLLAGPLRGIVQTLHYSCPQAMSTPTFTVLIMMGYFDGLGIGYKKYCSLCSASELDHPDDPVFQLFIGDRSAAEKKYQYTKRRNPSRALKSHSCALCSCKSIFSHVFRCCSSFEFGYGCNAVCRRHVHSSTRASLRTCGVVNEGRCIRQEVPVSSFATASAAPEGPRKGRSRGSCAPESRRIFAP